MFYDQKTNVACVMVFLAIVMAALILLTFYRTCGRMLARSTPTKWKVFYGIIWVWVILCDSMYWAVSLYTMNMNQNSVRMFTLVYFPAVMTTLAYMMIYEAMEKSVKEGKIRVSLARFQSE